MLVIMPGGMVVKTDTLRSDATLGWSSPWGGLPEVIPWSSVLAREVVPENAAGVLVLMAVDAKRGGCRP